MSGDGKVDIQALTVEMLQGKESPLEPPDVTDNVEVEVPEGTEPEPETESKPIVGGHPAWEDILSVLPEEYQQAITPKLKEWDAGVTRRFQEIHSQYKPLKDFEPVVAQGLDPDSFSQAIGLYQALNKNPQEVYDALGEAYGFSGQESEPDYDVEEYRLPKSVQEQLAKQERALEYMAEQMQAQQQSAQEQQQTSELDAYLVGLHSSYGEFDEDYVLTKMANGEDGEVAVRKFQEITGHHVPKPSAPTPKILGSSGVGSGGIPTDSPEVTKLSDKDTRSLVEQALRAASQI
jgi:hypothetical protein